MEDPVKVTSWPDDNPPSRDQLWLSMTDEGLSPYAWSNAPHDVYAAHSHSYNKAGCQDALRNIHTANIFR